MTITPPPAERAVPTTDTSTVPSLVNPAPEAAPTVDTAAVGAQLAETREEINRVDGKASIMLAGAGVAVGTVVAGLIAGDLQIDKLAVIVVVLAALAAASTLAGIAFLGAAIYPHCGTAEPARARYFTEVATYNTHDDLRVALARDAAAGDRLVHQLLGLSKAVASKYRRLRWGMRLLGLAIAFGTAAGVLDLVLG